MRVNRVLRVLPYNTGKAAVNFETTIEKNQKFLFNLINYFLVILRSWNCPLVCQLGKQANKQIKTKTPRSLLIRGLQEQQIDTLLLPRRAVCFMLRRSSISSCGCGVACELRVRVRRRPKSCRHPRPKHTKSCHHRSKTPCKHHTFQCTISPLFLRRDPLSALCIIRDKFIRGSAVGALTRSGVGCKQTVFHSE